MYLGVHWPIDVIVGTAIGLLSGLLLSDIFQRIYEDRSWCLSFTLISGMATLLLSIILIVLLELDTIDAVAFSDLMSNAAVTSGSALGIYLDRRFLEYDERSGSVAKKAVRYIAGIAVVAALAVMISLIPLPRYASSSLLFFMAGASVTFIYPAIALKAGLFR